MSRPRTTVPNKHWQVRSKLTWEFNEFEDAEVNLEPSMTVPDESYSIQEILERFTRGFMPETKTGIYIEDDENLPENFLGDEDLEKFNAMDIADQEAIVGEIRYHMEANKARIAAQEEDKKKAENEGQKPDPKTAKSDELE